MPPINGWAYGYTYIEIATELGVSVGKIDDWRFRHADLWTLAYDQTMADVVEVVRETAGTDAVTLEPTKYIRMAVKAEKWTRQHGDTLFKAADGELTLRRFYETHYLPQCMAPDATDGYKSQWEVVLKRWELVCGIAPIQEIDSELLARFRDVLIDTEGWIAGKKLSPHSVRRFLTYVQRLLDAAGPRSRHNRNAAGIMSEVPYVRPPRALLRTPRIAPPELIGRAYAAADKMRVPKIPGVKPADFWRSLLATVLNTGIRRRTALSLRMSDIDWNRRLLDIPPERLKARRGETIHLNGTAYGHLLRIRTDRDRVFQWDHDIRSFGRALHRLQDLAGIPRVDHFGLHAIRKTLGSALVRHSTEAARLALGHNSFSTTERHYVAAEGFVAEALDQLPQPAAFIREGGAA